MSLDGGSSTPPITHMTLFWGPGHHPVVLGTQRTRPHWITTNYTK